MRRIIALFGTISLLLSFSLEAQVPKTIKSKEQVVEQNQKGSFEKNVLVEFFTAEWCGVCPGAHAKLNQAISMLDEAHRAKTFVASLHYDDAISTQWQDVDAITSSVFSNFGLTGTPTALVDRREKSGMEASIGTVEQLKDKLLSAFGDDSAQAELKIELQQGSNNLVKINGKVDPALMNKALFLTVYVLKSKLKPLAPSGQTNGGPNYLHNNTVLMLLTDNQYGEQISIEDNQTFTWNKEFQLANFDAADTDVIAFIHYELDMAPSVRHIINSAKEKLDGATSSVQAVSDDFEIDIKTIGGKLNIDGDYDRFSIYSMNGVKLRNEGLKTGKYLIRVEKGTRLKFIKVCMP